MNDKHARSIDTPPEHPASGRRRGRTRKEQRQAFGHLLWNILGGADANLHLAARHLRMTQSTLEDIIHGRRTVSRRIIAERRWHDVFAQHYPAAWFRLAAEFDRLATDPAPRRRRWVEIPEPANKLSLGHVLWCILGGRDADFAKAARRLDVTLPRLKKALSGESRIPMGLISDKHWRTGYSRRIIRPPGQRWRQPLRSAPRWTPKKSSPSGGKRGLDPKQALVMCSG